MKTRQHTHNSQGIRNIKATKINKIKLALDIVLEGIRRRQGTRGLERQKHKIELFIRHL